MAAPGARRRKDHAASARAWTRCGPHPNAAMPRVRRPPTPAHGAPASRVTRLLQPPLRDQRRRFIGDVAARPRSAVAGRPRGDNDTAAEIPSATRFAQLKGPSTGDGRRRPTRNNWCTPTSRIRGEVCEVVQCFLSQTQCRASSARARRRLPGERDGAWRSPCGSCATAPEPASPPRHRKRADDDGLLGGCT